MNIGTGLLKKIKDTASGKSKALKDRAKDALSRNVLRGRNEAIMRDHHAAYGGQSSITHPNYIHNARRATGLKLKQNSGLASRKHVSEYLEKKHPQFLDMNTGNKK